MPKAPSLIASYEWGIDPDSSRRRWKTLLRFCFPLLMYGAALAVMEVVWWNEGDNVLFAASVCAGSIAIPFICIINTFFDRAAIRMRRNWSDYRMACICGRDMLWALSGPAIKGAILLGAIHLIFVFLGMHVADEIDVGSDDFWFFLSLSAGLVFLIIAGGFLLAALWALQKTWVARLYSLMALVLTSPTLIYFAIAMASELLGYNVGEEFFEVTALGEVISFSLRGWLVARVWKRATRKLDGEFGD